MPLDEVTFVLPITQSAAAAKHREQSEEPDEARRGFWNDTELEVVATDGEFAGMATSKIAVTEVCHVKIGAGEGD